MAATFEVPVSVQAVLDRLVQVRLVTGMRTWVYMDRHGERYLIFHRNASNRAWEHPYSEKGTCGACLGTSTAAPDDLRPQRQPKEVKD